MHKFCRFFHAVRPLFFSCAMLILPRIVFADNGETPVSEGLGYVLDAMYGATGMALAALAIIAVGVLCAAHVLEWKRLIQTVVGIAFIFGAPPIVKGIVSLIHT
jgi:type IV secretory pathway VirB2 component (pilin)